MRKRQKEKILELIQTFRQAHKEILMAVLKGEETAFLLLEQCQQGAVRIGEIIEQSENECSEIIGSLEAYCEWLYEKYQAFVSNEEPAEDFLKEGDAFCHRLSRQIAKDISVRREVVFLPYKASMWDSLESVWMAAREDPSCDAYVVPLPYYDRRQDHSFGQLHDESEMYPSYVPITRYTEYDLKERHPDMIFIHNPYDDSNFVTSVHPFFYSENLRNYTDCLVYIPYFVLEDQPCSNREYTEAVAHFCNVPALQYADRVIVQSEQMRETYIQVLTQTWGTESRPIWEKKILGLGSPKMDKGTAGKQELQIPDPWRKRMYWPDGSKKKIVLYNTSVSALLQHGEKMLDKMADVFSVFRERQKQTALLWRPHPLTLSTLQAMRPELLEPYRELEIRYQNEGWGIFDDSPDLVRALLLCDAYYGDRSSLVQLCQNMGKPILIQAVDQREYL